MTIHISTYNAQYKKVKSQKRHRYDYSTKKNIVQNENWEGNRRKTRKMCYVIEIQ